MGTRTMSLAVALAATIPGLSACGKAPATAAAVRPAPAFELPDLKGGKASLGSFQGKVVVLDFWATWCGPCIQEIPEYAAFWTRNRSRGVEVVGVVMDSGDPQDIEEFVREHRIPYRQLLGNDEVLDAFGANQGLPTTFVIDGNGTIRAKTVGAMQGKFEKLQRDVDAALAGGSGAEPRSGGSPRGPTAGIHSRRESPEDGRT